MFENRPDARFSDVCWNSDDFVRRLSDVALSFCMIYLKFSTPCILTVNHFFYSN